MGVTPESIARSAEILAKCGASRVILFGSALESPETARDLDLAVDGLNGWDFFRAGAEVEREVRVVLDLVPLSPPTRFTRYIERKGKVIYDRG